MAHPRLEARRSTWIDWTDRAARERRESERLNVRTSRSTYKPYGSTTTLIDKKRVVFACWPLGLSSSSLSSRPFFFSARILLSIDRRSFVPCILAIFSEEKKIASFFSSHVIRPYILFRIMEIWWSQFSDYLYATSFFYDRIKFIVDSIIDFLIMIDQVSDWNFSIKLVLLLNTIECNLLE